MSAIRCLFLWYWWYKDYVLYKYVKQSSVFKTCNFRHWSVIWKPQRLGYLISINNIPS
jgi:hypothetical protein